MWYLNLHLHLSFFIRNFYTILSTAREETDTPFSSLNRAVDDISLEDLLSTVPSLKVRCDN